MSAIVPAEVRGPFARARKLVFAFLIVLLAVLPHLQMHGEPAVRLDIPARRFFLFGAALNAQDTPLLFFVLSGVGFTLVFATALVGRAWCGWVCPQTVLLEGIFRRIERWVDGTRSEALRRARGPVGPSFVSRAVLKHLLYIVAAIACAYAALAYFVVASRAFAVVLVAGVLYADFAWFREQVCTLVCPYGRLQSVLLDDDSLIVGYDAKRGEPRGKQLHGERAGGDCVDCGRCTAVCPTGIDIRDGLQLECVACTACIDACDVVMLRLGRDTGLVRYASPRGLAGGRTRILRPRVLLYTGLMLLGAGVAFAAGRHRTDVALGVTRLPGAPYTVEAHVLHNAFDLHLVNKSPRARSFTVQIDAPSPLTAVVAIPVVSLAPWSDSHVPLFVAMPAADYAHDLSVPVRVLASDGASAAAAAPFLGARE